MKLIDIASRIDKSERNRDWIDTQEMGYELGLDNVPYVEQERLTCYWVGYWLCTDSWVGYRMYFFDGEAVAFSIQFGRKVSEKFYWFSVEIATKVRDYLLSLIVEEDRGLGVEVCDINEDIGDDFKIDYSGQILSSDKMTLKGEKVELLERIKHTDYGIDTELKVKLPSGEEKNVSVRDCRFGFHVTK